MGKDPAGGANGARLEEYHRSLGDFATIEATGKTQCEAAHTHVDFRANESPGVLAGASKEECRMSIWGSRCPGRSDILFHGGTNHARRGPRRGGGAIRSRWHIRCAALTVEMVLLIVILTFAIGFALNWWFDTH
jgi:hypothetical protein